MFDFFKIAILAFPIPYNYKLFVIQCNLVNRSFRYFISILIYLLKNTKQKIQIVYLNRIKCLHLKCATQRPTNKRIVHNNPHSSEIAKVGQHCTSATHDASHEFDLKTSKCIYEIIFH